MEITREEALDELELLASKKRFKLTPGEASALDVAIKALKQDQIFDGVTNGELLKNIFPNSVVNSHLSDFGANGIDMRIDFGTKHCFKLWFPTDWWHAQYDGGIG